MTNNIASVEVASRFPLATPVSPGPEANLTILKRLPHWKLIKEERPIIVCRSEVERKSTGYIPSGPVDSESLRSA